MNSSSVSPQVDLSTLESDIKLIKQRCQNEDCRSIALENLCKGMTVSTAIKFAFIEHKREEKNQGMQEGSLSGNLLRARKLFNKIVQEEKELGLLSKEEAEKKAIAAGGFKPMAPSFLYLDDDSGDEGLGSRYDCIANPDDSTDPLDLLIAREEVLETAGSEEFADVLDSQDISSLHKIKEYLETEATFSSGVLGMLDVLRGSCDAVSEVVGLTERRVQQMIKDAESIMNKYPLLVSPADRAEVFCSLLMQERKKTASKKDSTVQVSATAIAAERAKASRNLFEMEMA